MAWLCHPIDVVAFGRVAIWVLAPFSLFSNATTPLVSICSLSERMYVELMQKYVQY
jgi:hypothetical protein